MKSAVRAVRPGRLPTPTAIHVVKFGQRPKRAPRFEKLPPGRVPRVARLLALAHRIDGMIRSAEIRDWAEAARLIGVTRARMTQIARLLLLSPRIQEIILELPLVSIGRDLVSECHLRPLGAQPEWEKQRRLR